MKCCIFELYYGCEFEVSVDEFIQFIDSLKFEEDFHVEYSSDREILSHERNISNISFYVGEDKVGYMYC